MKSRFLFTILILSFLAQQCAKQTAPTGGVKDEIPPKLTGSNPANKETKFNKSKIELTFDEHIQLNNPTEQIIITPTIGKKFEVTARKNKAVLEFKSPLRDSTTYNINFRECIQDLNEKNPAVIKLAFSTGPYLDSLSISGSVTDVLTETVVKNYTVALTEVRDTFNIFKHQASWITLTDAEGKFMLENLKPGTYSIYAFEDKNKNLVVDSKSERYGFMPNSVSLNKSVDSIKIQTFKLDRTQLKLISSKPTFSYFLIRLSKSVATYTLEPQEKIDRIFSDLEPDKASIKIYNTLPQKSDSLQLKVMVEDSTHTRIDTLIYLKFSQKETTNKDQLKAKIEYARYLETKGTMLAEVSFSKPTPIINTDSIYIKTDSLNKIIFLKEDLEWNQTFTRLKLKKKYSFKEPKSSNTQPKKDMPVKGASEEPKKATQTYNELTFPKGTFISVEGDTAAQLNQSVGKITLEQTGIIMTEVKTTEDFVLQLTSTNNQIIEEVKNVKNHKFENLSPATYFIRLIIDVNKNGKWDAGNILTGTEPEPVHFYRNSKKEKEVNLKANWEVGPLLITH